MVMKSFIRLLLLVFCCAPPAVVTAETRPLRDTRLTQSQTPWGQTPSLPPPRWANLVSSYSPLLGVAASTSPWSS